MDTLRDWLVQTSYVENQFEQHNILSKEQAAIWSGSVVLEQLTLAKISPEKGYFSNRLKNQAVIA